MKQKNRIWIYPLIAMGILLMLSTSCKKDETEADVASEIAGIYNGTVTVVGTGSMAASSTIEKTSETKVKLTITVATQSIPLPGIDVSSSGSNIYNLSLTDASGTFTGTVNGNTLTWTMTADGETLTFTGTKN